jgi:fermentation-respiration switch protein FrsA (DUF1100 family)
LSASPSPNIVDPDSRHSDSAEQSSNHPASSGVSSSSSLKSAKTPSLDELLLFFPSKYPDGNWKPGGLKFEDAWFKSDDGTRLHGWYCPCDNPRAVLLHAHGNAGNLSHRADLMKYYQEKLRVTAFIFDYRGYGRSEGTPTAEGILQDARAARKFLARRAAVTESQIVISGQSLGGAVAIDLAAKDGACGLVIEKHVFIVEGCCLISLSEACLACPGGKAGLWCAHRPLQGPSASKSWRQGWHHPLSSGKKAV